MFKKGGFALLLLVFFFVTIGAFRGEGQQKIGDRATVQVLRQNVRVELHTIGELESAKSQMIASSIKGDQAKIIDLISDGAYVSQGDLLVRIDPVPFHERVEKLQTALKEQEAFIKGCEQTLAWEKIQARHKTRSFALEMEAAELELAKIKEAEGPQERAKLLSVQQKSLQTYEELLAYTADLRELEQEGILNGVEIRQLKKKLKDAQEALELAEQQVVNFERHLYPMLVKKAETQLKRLEVGKEEAIQAGRYAIAKAKASLEQAWESLADLQLQYQEALEELRSTEIRAPSEGLVVLKEEYRAGQKRKPRVGDLALKNQPLIELPDLSTMLIRTKIRESDLFKVAAGKTATIQIDAYPDLHLTGQVTQIGVLAMGNDRDGSEEKFFEVLIALFESDKRLRPGMTARSVIFSEEKKSVLSLPLHAIFFDAQKPYCFVWNGEKGAERRALRLGCSNEYRVEVLEGVSEKERVCLTDPTRS